MKSKFFKPGVLALSSLLIAVSIGSLNVNASDIDVSIKTLSVRENFKNIDFNLEYPEVKVGNEHVQNKINALLKQGVYDFKKYLEDVYNETASMYPEEIVKNAGAFAYEGSSNYEFQVVGNVLSVKVMFTQYTGGAHPMTYAKVYNFDLKTGNSLEIEDIFNENGKKVYRELINNQVMSKISENPENYFVEEFRGVNENTQYYLTKEGINVIFQLYELAPYSAGMPEFKIPYELFKDKLNINNLK